MPIDSPQSFVSCEAKVAIKMGSFNRIIDRWFGWELSGPLPQEITENTKEIYVPPCALVDQPVKH